MKKALLLLFAGALCICSCTPKEEPYDYLDKEITGTAVEIPKGLDVRKIFLLNEGQMGSNNASLDLLRVNDGQYITSIWKKMNLNEGPSLGDVANDIVVIGNEVWMTINNSGYVEVISAKDETHITSITIPTPRSIAFDDKYAYVSSYSGAYITYGANYAITDSKNVKGHVYRIDLATHKLAGDPVEVGYQPEGLAVYNGKLYVANSGGISSSLPPAYAYDRTVSVIDTRTFEVEKTIDVEVNLQKVYSDGKGNIYVSSYGNYYSVHSCLWVIKADGSVAKVSDYASYSTISGDTVYCIGNENEFDYYSPAKWTAWSCKDGARQPWDISLGTVNPYGIAALPDGSFVISDAGDYYNPGNVSLFVNGAKKWTVAAGVCPGHFAIW